MDTAAELRDQEQEQGQGQGQGLKDSTRTLDCNQVLINEYQADQGISVGPISSPHLPLPLFKEDEEGGYHGLRFQSLLTRTL